MVSKRQHNDGAHGNENEGSSGDDNINNYDNDDDDDENLEIHIIWLLRFSFFFLPSLFPRFLPAP